MLQKRPDDRERPQKQHDGSKKITKEKHNANTLHNKPNEGVFGQNQGDAAKKEKRGLNLGRASKEVDGPRRADDQHHANDKENIAYGE